MKYPVLAKVRYDKLDTVTRDRALLLSSLLLNWILDPLLMFRGSTVTAGNVVLHDHIAMPLARATMIRPVRYAGRSGTIT